MPAPFSPQTKLSGRNSSPYGDAWVDNCDGVVDGNGDDGDGDLHLDVVDDARLKIDTDSSRDIIAMVPLYKCKNIIEL